MADYQTVIKFLGVEVPVTVSWICRGYGSDAEVEIEQVTSDVLGDITDRILNDCIGTGFYTLNVDARDGKYHDPLQVALFGRASAYTLNDPRLRSVAAPYRYAPQGSAMYMVQHEPTRTVLRPEGALEELLCDQIYETDSFVEAMWSRDSDW